MASYHQPPSPSLDQESKRVNICNIQMMGHNLTITRITPAPCCGDGSPTYRAVVYDPETHETIEIFERAGSLDDLFLAMESVFIDRITNQPSLN